MYGYSCEKRKGCVVGCGNSDRRSTWEEESSAVILGSPGRTRREHATVVLSKRNAFKVGDGST